MANKPNSVMPQAMAIACTEAICNLQMGDSHLLYADYRTVETENEFIVNQFIILFSQNSKAYVLVRMAGLIYIVFSRK